MARRYQDTTQDDILRLLDTRIACLMVDRPDASNLRPALLRLRGKLLQERLDGATLSKVEATLRELMPPGTARTYATIGDDRARAQARVRLVKR
jgi:hypothetical protein